MKMSGGISMQKISANRLDRGFYMYQEEFEHAALRVLRSGWYILGKEVMCDQVFFFF